jgi:Raf kinase inhibitor-like YbhB/YbcL family protein
MKRQIIPVWLEKLEFDGILPERYSCHGGNINPPLLIQNVPDGTKSLALIMDSCDEKSTSQTHWVVWNLPATCKIFENEQRGEFGINDFGSKGYYGPCAIASPLKCTFRIYAFDRFLNFSFSPVTKFDLYASVIYFGLGHGLVSCNYFKKHTKKPLVTA